MAAGFVNDRYRIVRRIGAGADGTVWLVEDSLDDDAPRALKLVADLDRARRARLAAEFSRLARLSHPNLLQVYDLAQVHRATEEIPVGAMFFTAAYAPGDDPVRAIGRVQPDRRTALTLDLADQIAGALAHVHAAGLVHCDVKPGNVSVRVDAEGLTATLLDLGVSAARGLAGDVRGTPAYMAPEAISGRIDPRGDLYGLGVTLHEVLTERAAFPQSGASLIRAICDGDSVPLRCAWAPASLVDLIQRLADPSAASRPSSAVVLLDELARVRDALGLPRTCELRLPPPSLLPPRIVGRDATLEAVRDAICRRGHTGAPRIVRLIGPPGAGKRAIIDEALRRHQLEVAAERTEATPIIRGDAKTVARALAVHAPSAHLALTPDAPLAALALWVDEQLTAAVAAAHDHGLLLVLEAADDERCDALVAAVEAGHPALVDGRVLVLTTTDAEPAQEILREGPRLLLPVPPLDAKTITELATSMLGRAPAAAWSRILATVCGGLPRLATAAIRAAAAESGILRVDQVDLTAISSDHATLSSLLVRRVAALPPQLASVLEALAVHSGRATPDALAVTLNVSVQVVLAASYELSGQQLVVIDEDEIRLPSRAHCDTLHNALPTARSKALHRAALRWCEAQPTPAPIAVAEHLAVTGPARRAVSAATDAAARLSSSGRPRYALRVLRGAEAVASGAAAAEVGLLIAEISIDVGAYDDAIVAAQPAVRSRDPRRRSRALRAVARARQKSGDFSAAETILAKLVAADAHDQEAAGAYARLLVSLGRYEEALHVAGDAMGEPVDNEPLDRGLSARLEATALALLYQDHLDEASAVLGRLEHAARTSRSRSLVGRAQGLRGMVAQWSGNMDDAAALYASAHESASAAGNLHAAAVYAINRGAVCSARGRYGEALVALDTATVALRRIGRVAELAGAVFNRGIALLRLGEIQAARRAADDARALAEEYGTPHWQIYAQLLDGDVARREGDGARARASYGAALEIARSLGAARELVHVLVNVAELSAEDGNRAALGLCDEADEHATTAEDHDACLLTRARVALSLDREDADLCQRLERAAERLADAGSHDCAWRSHVAAARLAHAAGDTARASHLAERARRTLNRIVRETQEARRVGVASDPDALTLRALEDQLPSKAAELAHARTAPPRQARDFQRLLALSRRLNSELNLTPLLDQVIDTVIELTCAERGFLLLRDPNTRQLEVVVARNFEQSELSGDELQVSRSIAERAARTGEAILTVDAGVDERFGGAASVAALRLRSVVAVPLRQKGRITGTIYVDHRFRGGAFDDDAILLMQELADIAAVAIENARLVDENRRRAEQIATLNLRLEAEVVEKEAELANVRAKLTSDRRAGLRHAYDAIIGRAPAMQEMLRTLDRATETDLPVVILGESGTGKELVARALHDNGSRRGEAFVAINCGAVPEMLLESELFGHARGAFTGATRHRQGLFQVADGGTLLLDEVADTSLAMQAKLLRVLQEREIRPVGETRTRPVDVRVVAASNRDLRELVAQGQFREDLYYRLEVLRIEVPPLRARVEDIPVLAAHILARLSTSRTPPQLTKAAVARLCSHSWPGNVRELENELARAAALGDDVIDVADLSPRIASASPAPVHDDMDSLLLKPQVEALERTLVEEAIAQTRGNQTAAAKLLGLSRYGLQKKLKRYGISGSR